MTQFEDLLPFIRSRVVEVGDVAPAGHVARLDDELYFRVIQVPRAIRRSYVAMLMFTFFPAADGSAITPPLDVVARVATVWLGVGHRPLGGILGGSGARANLRRAQRALGAQFASMVAVEAGPSAKYDPWHSKPLESGDPKRWVTARFTVPPKGFLGSGTYDWES